METQVRFGGWILIQRQGIARDAIEVEVLGLKNRAYREKSCKEDVLFHGLQDNFLKFYLHAEVQL